MKKLLILLVSVLFIFAFVGCNEQADTPMISEEIPPTMDIPSEPVEQQDPAPAQEEPGVIVGDVLFNGIPISQLFTEPFLDILGEPIEQNGDTFSYEGLSIVGLLSSAADQEEWAEYDNMAIQFSIFEPSLDSFKLNGVSLPATRAELRAAFGVPNGNSPSLLTYRVSNPTIEYMIEFWFRDWDKNSYVSSIRIYRIAADEYRPVATIAPPEQLIGTWENALGATLTFPDENYTPEQWLTYTTPIGAYRIYAIADCGAHTTFWLFPIGVEMIRYNTNGSLVPSDTSVVRLYQFSFDVTTCCPDEEILQEVFYMVQP